MNALNPLSIAIFTLSISLFAKADYQPSIGQSATLMLTSNDSSSGSYTKKDVLDSITANQDFWVNTFAIYDDGEEKLIRSWLLKDKKKYFISDLTLFCKQHKGLAELITVTAGTFATCKIVYSDDVTEEHFWYTSKVPFGLVKSIVLKGSGYNRELINYSN